MKKWLLKLGFWFLLISWLAFALGPYLWMLLTSLKPSQEIFTLPIKWFPQHWTLNAYNELLMRTPFLQFMKHSLFVASLTMVFTLMLAIPAGYSLSRHSYRNKKMILSLLVSTQFFPTILLILALYPIINALGLMHNLMSLVVVYTAFTTPFAIWLIKGFFDSIPKELDEAAKVDGCNEFQAMLYVLFPAVGPGLVAAAAYVVIFSWNEFLFALTFTSNSDSSTLPVGLQTFIGDYVTRWDLLTAGGAFSAIPILLFFILIQKRLISGLTAGAVK